MGVPMVTVQKLRFCDTDMLGHVNNAIYSVLLEAGRVEMAYEAGLIRPEEGFSLVIARLELDYVAELNWPGTVRVETVVHRLGNKSLQMRQRIVSESEIAAKAHTVLAVMDLATRKAMPLREDWRAALERWLVPEF